ncbi:MAG: glucose-1-phosphate adenylyltransferase subunit GlgD [Lachnospiraceae bacterium]|nr:glucose-1-phosphate adenylyltransferase subunit GlgD [Lachnospiraceae bacterium]
MRAIGIILAGGNNKKMKELSAKRAVAAMPMAGSYRAIDFALSNMTNSHVRKVGVLTQYNAQSLNEHLSSSKWWDFGRKQGGLYLFTPTLKTDMTIGYRGTADALYQNLDFLKKSHEPYVIVASGDSIYKLDYNKVLEYHIDKKAEITVVTTKLPEGDDPLRYGLVKTDEEGRITEFQEKPLVAESDMISTGIYVIRRRLLIELVEACIQDGRYDLVSDIIVRYRGLKRVYAYELTTYWRNIATAESYYNTNMDFLKKDVRDYFYREYPEVYSKVDDLPPAKYNPGAKVSNSLIASGSIINGEIENSILFKKTYVGDNCVIKNSIILNDVYIGDGAYIENCIVESRGTIKEGARLIGNPDDINIVVEKNERYIM